MINPIIFGKFILLERISSGGMAEVYRAKLLNAPEFERYFAIKRILPHLAQDKEFVTMFINEAKVAVELEHPNVCQIYELGRLGQSHYIAMEYIAGRDIEAIQNYYRREKKIMSVSQACFIIAQAAQGLDYAHRAVDASGRPLGLIHRDISPQNLIVTYSGIVKLIDFGVAKVSRSAPKKGTDGVKGKYSYMSPEQAADKDIDHRTDIFALGIIFWELLTGRRLFQSENEFAVLDMVTQCDIPLPSKYNRTIPKDIDRICMKALAKDPNERYAYASDMVVDLFEFINSCKVPFTQWHLQNWMCKIFEEGLRNEWNKIPIFQKINTAADIEKYTREHPLETSSQSASSFSNASVSRENSQNGSDDSMRDMRDMRDIIDAPTMDSEVLSISDSNSIKSPPALPPIPGRSQSANGEISKSIPGVKHISLPNQPAIDGNSKPSGESSGKLSISSAPSSDDDDTELKPEDLAPDVSDPQLLAIKRAERKASMRKILTVLISTICIFFVLSPITLLAFKNKLPKPTPDLPTAVELSWEISPETPNTKVKIFSAADKNKSKPVYEGTGVKNTVQNLSTGNYIIDVDMPGYEPESFSIAIDKNGQAATRLDLTHPLPVLTECTVSLTPPDARLYLNGNLVPGTGETRIFSGTVGKNYDIRVFKPGFEPMSASGTIENNMTLPFELVPGDPVTVTIESEPPKSEVFISKNDRMVKVGDTPYTIENIDASVPLVIEVKKIGRTAWDYVIDFDTVETNTIRLFADLPVK